MERSRLSDGECLDVQGRRALAALSNAHDDQPLIHPTLVVRRSPFNTLKPQHFCFVTETYPPDINGVALTLARLANGLLTRGHTVSVVHPKVRNRPASNGFGDVGNSEDILVRGFPLPGYQGLQFGAPAGRLLRQSWRHQRPAAVYVATEGPLGWSAIRAARKLGIPVVSGFHTNFHRYCKHYGLGRLQDLALRYLRSFHNHTECTLVANEDLRARLQDAGFHRVNILERGVDSQLFSPQRRCPELRREWGVSDQDRVLLYVGRVAAEKNLDLAIETYRVIKRFSDTTKFVIVGDGPLRPVLQREHTDLVFAGMHVDEQLAKYYASADIFLFPSETETFGNVTLEAMASGLAVIAYDYAGAKLHINDGESGVLVRFGDAKAFVDSACSLVRQPEVIRRIRLQARQHVSHLNWPDVVERFEALLLGIGEQRHRALPSPLTARRLAT
jgi:glycosyltransferase involved in cell wall biosynthesis